MGHDMTNSYVSEPIHEVQETGKTHKWWGVFLTMGVIGTLFEFTTLWNFMLSPSWQAFYFAAPYLAPFLLLIGVFQLVRCVMYTYAFIKEPKLNTLLELLIMWPGVITMNFATICIVITCFGGAAPITGFVVSFYFVGGAALLFAKTLVWDVIRPLYRNVQYSRKAKKLEKKLTKLKQSAMINNKKDAFDAIVDKSIGVEDDTLTENEAGILLAHASSLCESAGIYPWKLDRGLQLTLETLRLFTLNNNYSELIKHTTRPLALLENLGEFQKQVVLSFVNKQLQESLSNLESDISATKNEYDAKMRELSSLPEDVAGADNLQGGLNEQIAKLTEKLGQLIKIKEELGANLDNFKPHTVASASNAEIIAALRKLTIGDNIDALNREINRLVLESEIAKLELEHENSVNGAKDAWHHLATEGKPCLLWASILFAVLCCFSLPQMGFAIPAIVIATSVIVLFAAVVYFTWDGLAALWLGKADNNDGISEAATAEIKSNPNNYPSSPQPEAYQSVTNDITDRLLAIKKRLSDLDKSKKTKKMQDWLVQLQAVDATEVNKASNPHEKRALYRQIVNEAIRKTKRVRIFRSSETHRIYSEIAKGVELANVTDEAHKTPWTKPITMLRNLWGSIYNYFSNAMDKSPEKSDEQSQLLPIEEVARIKVDAWLNANTKKSERSDFYSSSNAFTPFRESLEYFFALCLSRNSNVSDNVVTLNADGVVALAGSDDGVSSLDWGGIDDSNTGGKMDYLRAYNKVIMHFDKLKGDDIKLAKKLSNKSINNIDRLLNIFGNNTGASEGAKGYDAKFELLADYETIKAQGTNANPDATESLFGSTFFRWWSASFATNQFSTKDGSPALIKKDALRRGDAAALSKYDANAETATRSYSAEEQAKGLAPRW